MMAFFVEVGNVFQGVIEVLVAVTVHCCTTHFPVYSLALCNLSSCSNCWCACTLWYTSSHLWLEKRHGEMAVHFCCFYFLLR